MAEVYEWNYRIVFDNGVWVIREVHYEDNEPLGWCAAELCGKTPTELLEQYKQMQEAFELPILTLTEEGTLEREDLIEEGPRWYFPKKGVADATV